MPLRLIIARVLMREGLQQHGALVQVVGREGTVHHRIAYGLSAVAQFHMSRKSVDDRV